MDHDNVIDCLVSACHLHVLIFVLSYFLMLYWEQTSVNSVELKGFICCQNELSVCIQLWKASLVQPDRRFPLRLPLSAGDRPKHRWPISKLFIEQQLDHKQYNNVDHKGLNNITAYIFSDQAFFSSSTDSLTEHLRKTLVIVWWSFWASV